MQRITNIFTDCTDMVQHLRADLAGATRYIYFQFFKFEADELGKAIGELLIERAKAGVDVRVIYDAVACWYVPRCFFRHLQKGGVKVLGFNGLFSDNGIPVNFRNHRKIVSIDGAAAYVGGMNIAQRYCDGVHGGIWRDTHLRLTAPTAIQELESVFRWDWTECKGDLLLPQYHMEVRSPGRTIDNENQKNEASLYLSPIHILPINPTDKVMRMDALICYMLHRAQRYIYFQSPYFIPSATILSALKAARNKGMEVRLMLPIRGDKGILVPKATASHYDILLREGVKIYLYRRGYMHAKTIVMDDRLTSIGSANIDPRSLRLSYEITAVFTDGDTALQQRHIFEQDMAECKYLTLNDWEKRSLWQRFTERFARLFEHHF
ncbi:MAG: phosphatidylserine/phosphatidylglycerophosphate/cardiolipin synthase family protein [Paludibacteraceae bacterium]